jgi:hypothetical protein
MMLKRPPSKLIPASQAKSWLQTDAEWIEVEGFSQTTGTRFYRHKDGKGLLTSKHSRKSELFESAQAFLDLFELIQSRGSHHILSGLVPNDGRFIDRVDEYIVLFAKTCSIPNTMLDRTMESLDKVEKKLRKVANDQITTEQVFAGLVAYVGEVMRVHMNGRWIMRLSAQDGKTWEPWLIDDNGRACTPIVYLWDKYVEEEKMSLKGGAIIEMNNRMPITSDGSQSQILPMLK